MSLDVFPGVVNAIEGRGGPKMDVGNSSSSGSEGTGGSSIPVVLGPRPERVYSHTLLLELKDHPLARRWPPYLDPVFKNQRGVWDPDRWHLDRKRGETPTLGGHEGKDLEVRDLGGKKDRDGRRADRGGLEQDVEDIQNLVLSPQRRSFLGGCSNSGGGLGDGEVSLRPEQPGKRVGSGRILSRQERDRDDGERNFRRGDDFRRIPGGRGGNDDKFAVFRGRDRDDDRESRDPWMDDRRRDGPFHDERRGGDRDRDRDMRERNPQDRNRSRRRNNEPEWMNESITKADVIELRGFEEKREGPTETDPSLSTLPQSLSLGINKSGQRSLAPPGIPECGISVADLERDQRDKNASMEKENNNNNKPLNKTRATEKENVRQNFEMKDSENVAVKENGSHNNIDIMKNLGLHPNNQDEKSFNYDQIMESMNISSLLGGAPGLPDPQNHVKPAAQSRFSQFFNKNAVNEPKAQESRRSSIQDELLGATILKEINGEEGPVIKIPSPTEEERYFAPISPAAQTRATNNPLLEMIKNNNQYGQPRVQELEDRIKRSLGMGGPPSSGHNIQPNQQLQHPNPEVYKSMHGQNTNNFGNRAFHGKENRDTIEPQDNLSAFKKLVAMVGPQQDQRDQGVSFGPGVVRPSPLPASIPSNAPTEQEILERMMNANNPRPKIPLLPPALLNILAAHHIDAEVMARPEAKQIMVGLQTGNITIENILQQLGNPALQQRQKEMLLSVLKVKTMNEGPGRAGTGIGMPSQIPSQFGHPRSSPLPPNDQVMLLPQGGPTTRVSPLMFPHMVPPTHLNVSPAPQQARVPSPQEMTVLTQHIMQQALIKRKLEEQKENFRRRQGDIDAPPSTIPSSVPQPPNVASSSIPTSGSPLAFIPTSVMRKSAPERRDSDPHTRGNGGLNNVPEVKVTGQKDPTKDGSLQQQTHPPPSPGRAITKSKDDRPSSLELGQITNNQGGRRLSPQNLQHHPLFLQQMQHGGMPHNNPLLYLQNNPMAHLNHSMLNQANAMAQQQMATANYLAHGMDPRQAGRGPAQNLPRPHCVSPNRSRPVPGSNMTPSPQPQVGQGALARFFSPEVLAQAQSGAVPKMPPIPSLSDLRQQKVLTLEEIERQSAAVRI